MNSGISIDVDDKDKALIDVLGLRSELEADVKNSRNSNSDSIQNDITTTGKSLDNSKNINNNSDKTDGNVPKYLENPVEKHKLLFPNLLGTIISLS